MITEKRNKGNKGEKAVVKFLKKNKFRIITLNYTEKTGEIDIIAEDKNYIIFVEVKTRQEGQMLEPRFSVDYKKRMRILRTSNIFLQKHRTDKQPRFDIAEVIVNSKGKMSINYLENAFQQEGKYAAF